MARIRLYELANIDGTCTSPFVWRIRYALRAKAIPYDPVSIGFSAIRRIGPGTLKTVPILERDSQFTPESWDIAEQLDALAPDTRPLFSSGAELAMVKFFDKWLGTAIMPPMFRACVTDIFERLSAEDRDYFRESREKMFGETLEAVDLKAEANIEQMRAALLPMRLALRRAPYLGGETPNYADHIAWGCFAAFSPLSRRPLLADHDPLLGWLKRADDLYPSPGGQLS